MKLTKLEKKLICLIINIEKAIMQTGFDADKEWDEHKYKNDYLNADNIWRLFEDAFDKINNKRSSFLAEAFSHLALDLDEESGIIQDYIFEDTKYKDVESVLKDLIKEDKKWEKHYKEGEKVASKKSMERFFDDEEFCKSFQFLVHDERELLSQESEKLMCQQNIEIQGEWAAMVAPFTREEEAAFHKESEVFSRIVLENLDKRDKNIIHGFVIYGVYNTSEVYVEDILYELDEGELHWSRHYKDTLEERKKEETVRLEETAS